MKEVETAPGLSLRAGGLWVSGVWWGGVWWGGARGGGTLLNQARIVQHLQLTKRPLLAKKRPSRQESAALVETGSVGELQLQHVWAWRRTDGILRRGGGAETLPTVT